MTERASRISDVADRETPAALDAARERDIEAGFKRRQRDAALDADQDYAGMTVADVFKSAAEVEAGADQSRAQTAITEAEAELRDVLALEARGQDGATDAATEIRAKIAAAQVVAREAKQRAEAAVTGKTQ